MLYKGHIYGSSMSRRLKASKILALSGYRAAQINYFCLHKVVIKVGSQEQVTEQICAAVSWYDLQQWFCKPAMVFCIFTVMVLCFFQILHADYQFVLKVLSLIMVKSLFFVLYQLNIFNTMIFIITFLSFLSRYMYINIISH